MVISLFLLNEINNIGEKNTYTYFSLNYIKLYVIIGYFPLKIREVIFAGKTE